MKCKILLITIIVLGLFVAGCSGTAEKGFMQGNVLIGPIAPVEQPGQGATLHCDFYDARKIIICDKNGNKLLMQVDTECNTDENYARYRVELEPGIYIVMNGKVFNPDKVRKDRESNRFIALE